MDLDGSGTADTVLLYEGKSAVTVAIRFADPARKPQWFHFAVDSRREDAICALPVRLEAEPLDYDLGAAVGHRVAGFVRSKETSGFRIENGTCDAIHFYWNHDTHRVEWWRL